MNSVNGHVIAITTTTTCLYFGQFFSDFWKLGTLRLSCALLECTLFLVKIERSG